VGTKAVNALSETFLVRSHRDGQYVEARFARGELVDQKKFRIIAATHSPHLLASPETYVINLDRHVNRNVTTGPMGVEGASTIQ
jgi:DNA gyrase/topoisomerase IV subunit B